MLLLTLEPEGGLAEVTDDAVRQLTNDLAAINDSGVPVVVRVESSERIRIGRVLDQGAAGVMVPL